jgi:tellurite resistance-related uncharacterized protein
MTINKGFIASSLLFLVSVAVTLVSTTALSAPKPMSDLPKDVVQYSQVPKQGSFKAETIPKGLLKAHSTKKGTWGIIRVDCGSLEYQINEPTVRKFVLVAPAAGVIEPRVLHQVKPLSDDLQFVVEFYRLPNTGPVHEKRE